MHSCFKGILAFVFTIIISTSSLAEPYGHYDLKKILPVTETTSGKTYQFDVGYLDKVFLDIYKHSFKPLLPQFDSSEERNRALRDTQVLMKMLNTYISTTPNPNYQMLGRTALINHMAYSMGVSDARSIAEKQYEHMLSLKPNDPDTHFYYGILLLHTCQIDKTIEHLSASVNAGNNSAAILLATTYVIAGDNKKALNTLDIQLKNVPNNSNAKKLRDLIASGKAKEVVAAMQEKSCGKK
jgi:tetratricopeptide (TPR) repeat protein